MSISDRIKTLVTLDGPQYERGDHNAKIISICSQKGGVGKTTTAVNLGTALSYFHDKKVLVIDMDPQGHVEKSLGSLIQEGIEYTPLSKILTSKHGEMLDAVVKTELVNFHLTPGDKTLIEAEGALNSRIGKEFIIRRSIEAARTLYDYILFDCPPAIGNLTLNALCASDFVLIPCEMSVLAFEGVSDLLETFEEVTERLNPDLKILGVLFTRVDRRNIMMNDLIIENMKKYFGPKIFKTSILVNTALNKAQLEGRPVFHFEAHSSGAENYESLAGEVINRIRRQDDKAPALSKASSA